MSEIVARRRTEGTASKHQPLMAVRWDLHLPETMFVMWASAAIEDRLAPARTAGAGRRRIRVELDVVDSSGFSRDQVLELRHEGDLEFPDQRFDLTVKVDETPRGETPRLTVTAERPRARDIGAATPKPLERPFIGMGGVPKELGGVNEDRKTVFVEGTAEHCVDATGRPDSLVITTPVHPRLLGYMMDTVRNWRYQAIGEPGQIACVPIKISTSSR